MTQENESPEFDILPSKIFNMENETLGKDKMEYLSQEAKVMQNLDDITCELENLVKIQELLKQPYKNRAFAISKTWAIKFGKYLENVRILHKYISTHSMEILKFKSETSDVAVDVKKVNSEFDASFAKIEKPSAIMNFDLVFLSPVYQKKMENLIL